MQNKKIPLEVAVYSLPFSYIGNDIALVNILGLTLNLLCYRINGLKILYLDDGGRSVYAQRRASASSQTTNHYHESGIITSSGFILVQHESIKYKLFLYTKDKAGREEEKLKMESSDSWSLPAQMMAILFNSMLIYLPLRSSYV